ncbi:class I SAM-dependent methyltransferase [Paenibacillus sp. YYML68]|uniref:class I SAM-dependent methyltransferase n=1 Tax=Paenibacillus sp. YYML68 TaxID=2909250 RepID=UPI0024926B1B|nr:class I SAM-dependent methyltransferase [Paenibacillus sp. YYML68]
MGAGTSKDLFTDDEIWEQAWRDDRDTVLNKMKEAGYDPTSAFNHKAKSFNEQAFNDEGRKRAKRIMNWIEGQGVTFENASVLDIGAATGGFSVSFAERGAHVTAVESALPLVELLEANLIEFDVGKVKIVHEPFESIDVQARGWSQAFDLVFVSMCPVIMDWESVERVLQCARRFCYISLPASTREHNLVKDIWPLVSDQPFQTKPTEIGYLLHLLYLKGYSYESLVTREMTRKEVSREKALQEIMDVLKFSGIPENEQNHNIVAEYLERTYPLDKVEIHQGGRFGKVLIRLQDQSMYARENV